MKQHITVKELETLSHAAQQRLATWFDEHTINDDDLVRVYITQEYIGQFGGVFSGEWDSEHEFIYPEEYIGKLKNHRGTILPLLDIGQMMEIITESDVMMTVGVSGNTCDELWNVVKTLLETMSNLNKKDFLYDEKNNDSLFSLSKLTGKKVVDIIGYPSDPFGEAPLFKISQIVFEDGTTVHVEGEHDVAYIPADDSLKNMDFDTLERFIEE